MNSGGGKTQDSESRIQQLHVLEILVYTTETNSCVVPRSLLVATCSSNMLLHVLCRQHLLKHHVAAGKGSSVATASNDLVLDQAAVRSDHLNMGSAPVTQQATGSCTRGREDE
jgi:hypothetical protein